MNPLCCDYAVLGGDMRQVFLAQELAKKQTACHFALCAPPKPNENLLPLSSLEAAAGCSGIIICPIPLCRDAGFLNQAGAKERIPLTHLLSLLYPGQQFFAGCIPNDFACAAREKNVAIFDFMQDAELSYAGAAATAEGAICEAMQKSPLNLRHSKCAVLGYGKCGRAIAGALSRMPCFVAAAALPEEEIAQASLIAEYAVSLDTFFSQIGEYDFIFNTIPAKILTGEILSRAKPSVTILDIASAPGGVDFDAAARLMLNASSCPGLPGRYSPLSSALAILKSIKKFERR